MKTNRRRKQSARPPEGGLSRREFARGATVAAAAIAAIPGGILGAAALPSLDGSAVPALPQDPGKEKPKLTAEALAEAEAKVTEIFRRYGDRLNDEQKADVRRLMREAQAQVEALRAFPLANSDEPATILHLTGATRAAPRSRATPAAAKPAAKPATKPGT
jgi:hypothetical protein